MDTIELKFKLDILFEYILPISLFVIGALIYLVSYLIHFFKKRKK